MSLASRIPLAALVIGVVAACSSYDPNERVDVAVGQSGPDFLPVAIMLVDRCGQIDCHGSKYRNFRLYGYGSERLNPYDTPQSPFTQAEADEDYNALVALEPQILAQVFREGGAAPDRLTFMRKARNHERHKGGGPIVDGDQADICIQSWLQSHVDAETCKLAVPRLQNP